jgi:hypothetical protein
MAKEVVEIEDAAKKDGENEVVEIEDKKADADAGEKLDKLLSCLDSMSKRMDAMEAEDKARKDAAACPNAKADEGKDVGEEPGKPVEVAADKRKDADKDDEKELAELKATADAERARMDADIAKRIADVEAKLPRQMTDAEYSQMADAQARADAVYSAFGKRAPRPLDGETLHLYRRRLASSLKDHSKDWKSVDVRLLDSASFDVVEGKIYADAALAANHPDDLPEGEIRAIRSTDSDTGHRVTRFVGNASFVRQFKQPARIVTDMPLAKQSRAG